MYTITQDKNYIITGFVARDAETKSTKNGKDYVTFSVAIGKDKDDKSIWTSCKAWGDAAKVAATIVKGDTVLCVGRLDKHEYNGKTYKEIVCEFIIKMGATAAPPPAQQSADLGAEDDLAEFEEIIGGGENLPW